jgi:hypothetical protein
MHPDAPYFSILLCLMPDDFTCQVESTATQWVIITSTATNQRGEFLVITCVIILINNYSPQAR